MGKSVIRLSIVIAAGILLLNGQQNAFAQDTGPPALQKVAFFTVGGAAGGVIFGVALWMLDPLAPSADIRLNALTGMGGGCILGFVFGLMQLNRQAVLPYQQPQPGEGFDQGFYSPPVTILEHEEVRFARNKVRPRRIPLFQIDYRF